MSHFPAHSLRFASLAFHDRRAVVRDAAHLRYYQARVWGTRDPVIIAWACLERDCPVRDMFPGLETVTETGEHILSTNSWVTYVLRVLLTRGWLHWRSGVWEPAVDPSCRPWGQVADAVISWLVDTDRLWLETGPDQPPPRVLTFEHFDVYRHLLPVGLCGFARDLALSERPRLVFNTAFFLLEPDDLVNHHSALGNPLGLAVENGAIVRPALYRRAAIWHVPERGWQTGRVGMDAMIVTLPDGSRFAPESTPEQGRVTFRFNAARADGPVVYTRAWGLAHKGRVLGKTPGNPHRLEVTIVDRRLVGWQRGGGLLIPQNGFVLSFDDRQLSETQQQSLQQFGQVTYDVAIDALRGADQAIQGGPLLVHGGQEMLSPSALVEEEFWVSRQIQGRRVVGTAPTVFPDDIDRSRAARVGLGIDRDGDLLLVAIPGPHKDGIPRSASATGVTLQELARFLLAAGAIDALNLDGGGSTQVFIDGGTLFCQGDRRGYAHGVFDRMVPAVASVETSGPFTGHVSLYA